LDNIIVDCHYVCWSSSFALPDMTAEDQQVGVIYGFLRQILSVAKKLETNKFYFCWDSKKSHRKLIFPDYKKKRAAKKKELSPEDLNRIMATHQQMNELRTSVLSRIGFNNSFMRTGYEADDLMYHLARGLPGDKAIVTSDEDLYQVIDDHTKIYTIKSGKLFGKKELAKKYNGVTPEEWVKVKALGGCSSDEVPGIPGVGATKAIKYLHGDMKPNGIVFQRIESEEGKEIYKRNLELVKLPLHENKFNTCDQITQDKISVQSLVDTFDHYKFASFLRGNNFSDWKRIFIP